MIIGISGKIGSGKDLAGAIVNYIGSAHKPSFVQFNERAEAGYILAVDEHIVWHTKKFADALKQNVATLLGVSREMLEDRNFKEKELGEEWWYYQSGQGKILPYGHWTGVDKEIADARFLVKPTPRLILQRLGTEGVRETIHPNAWVNAAVAGYNNGKHWIFTDMRFPNEMDAVVRRGGITIRLERGDGNTGDHPSETALDGHIDKFDYVIDNNGTVQELFWRIHKIMDENGLL